MAGSARKISTCFPLTETYHELRSMFTSSIDKRLACKWVLIKLRISSCRKLSFINCRKEQKPVLKWGNEIITRQSSRSCLRVCLRSQSYIPPVVCGLQSLDRHARTLAETHQLSLLCNCLPPPLPSPPSSQSVTIVATWGSSGVSEICRRRQPRIKINTL